MLKGDSMFIVQYSGGIGSWCAAKRLCEKYDKDEVKLLFADTKIEDEDLYRFLHEGAEKLGCELIKIEDGRTPWQVFQDVKFIGNSRVDPCSKILKRDLLRKWMLNNCDPENDVVCIGIDWTEENRFTKAEPRHKPFKLIAPMCEKPYLTKVQMMDMLNDYELKPPRLYEMGFPHNNCGGFCVKAGQSHFKLLYEKMPERYKHHEDMEAETMKKINTENTVLKCRKGGTTKPLSLKQFRERIENKEKVPEYDFGGCGCAI